MMVGDLWKMEGGFLAGGGKLRPNHKPNITLSHDGTCTKSPETMAPQEISFTNAFNANRPTLALFAKCGTKDELHVVRDTFFLGLASQLCPEEYETLRTSIITDPRLVL
jgi:hypothetical protein